MMKCTNCQREMKPESFEKHKAHCKIREVREKPFMQQGSDFSSWDFYDYVFCEKYILIRYVCKICKLPFENEQLIRQHIEEMKH